MIGELIGGETLSMERAKAPFISKERTAGHGHAASKQRLNGGIEPDNRDALCAKKLGSALLRIGSSAEREYERFFCFGCTTEDRAELVGYKSAKSGLPKTLEKLRNTQAGGFLDAVVEINEAPGELAREERADGGLAGAHESG